RKYLVVTMLAALTLQKSGNSTPRCSKLTEPSRQLVITTSRRSQVTSSYGWTPSVVHTRPTRRPLLFVVWLLSSVPPAPDDVPTAPAIPSPSKSRGTGPPLKPTTNVHAPPAVAGPASPPAVADPTLRRSVPAQTFSAGLYRLDVTGATLRTQCGDL